MKNINKQRGEMDFLLMILLFLVVVFVIWVLSGGSRKSTTKDDPFINPYNNSNAPLKTYGGGDFR